MCNYFKIKKNKNQRLDGFSLHNLLQFLHTPHRVERFAGVESGGLQACFQLHDVLLRTVRLLPQLSRTRVAIRADGLKAGAVRHLVGGLRAVGAGNGNQIRRFGRHDRSFDVQPDEGSVQLHNYLVGCWFQRKGAVIRLDVNERRKEEGKLLTWRKRPRAGSPPRPSPSLPPAKIEFFVLFRKQLPSGDTAVSALELSRINAASTMQSHR